MERRTFIAASLGTVAAVASVGIAEGRGFHSASAPAFGTTIRISLFHPDRGVARRALAAAVRAVRQVDQLVNLDRPSSQVARLNRDGVLAHPDPHLLAMLETARALALLSRGAFDMTVQPLWQVYRDASRANGRPLRSERLKASAKVGWERVQCDAERVAFARPGMQLTLDGLAQGYAADLALAALRARGIVDALVDTGVFTTEGGKPGQRPWTVGVADPRQDGMLAASMQLDGRSAATSGDYACTFTPDFVHHHIFDPATGDSPQELASVTVLAPSGILADGMSTAFMVMGARKAHALAAGLAGVDVMTINKRGVVWKSPGFPSA